jgi:hypothetical protein
MPIVKEMSEKECIKKRFVDVDKLACPKREKEGIRLEQLKPKS